MHTCVVVFVSTVVTIENTVAHHPDVYVAVIVDCYVFSGWFRKYCAFSIVKEFPVVSVVVPIW